MIKRITTLVFCLFFTISMYATTGYTISGTGSNLTLTITGTGAMPDYNSYSGAPWYSQRGNIKTLVINSGVTSIGNYAFYDCRGLSGTLTIPNNVTRIGNYAFDSCDGLTSISIPSSVTRIGNQAFSHCNALSIINVDAANTNYSSVDGVLYNKNQTTLIVYPIGKQGAFTIPGRVTSIGNQAFLDCRSLTSISIPNSVMSIGNQAFSFCSGLTSISIPNSVMSIGDGAFSYCSGLICTLTIPNSVISIGNSAFSRCRGLSGALTIPESVTIIGSFAFHDCSGLSGALTIPGSVTSIGEAAFRGCSGLSGALTIPSSVISIGQYAFFGCSGFNGALTIPESVTSIGIYTFYNCSGLTSIFIPNSVTSIGSSAFQGCSKLTRIYCYPANPPTLGSNAFYSVPIYAELHVKCSSYSLYSTTALWKDFNILSTLTENYSIKATICSGKIYTENGFNENQTGIYVRTEKNRCGGDSIITLSLLVENPQTPTDMTVVYFSKGHKISWTAVGNNNSGYEIYRNSDFLATTAETSFQDNDLVPGNEYCYIVRAKNDGNCVSDFTTSVCKTATGTIAVTNVTLNKSTTSITLGSTEQLTATIQPTNATNKQVTWSSSNTSIATVSTSGLVKAKAAGKAIITVTTADGNYTATCEVTVEVIAVSSWQIGYPTPSDVTATLFNDGTLSIQGKGAMQNWEYQTAPWQSYRGDIKTAVLGSGVTTIGNYAFENILMTFVTISNSVTSIGECAFYGCSNLISAPIPNSVTVIGDYAFAGASLTSLTIPASVTSFGWCSFTCSKLTEIHSKKSIPVKLTKEKEAFNEVDKTTCKLYVPKGSSEVYRNANIWKDFFNIIEEDATAIETVNPNIISIHSVSNGIVIETKAAIPIAIFNIAGQKVYQSVVDGNAEISLNKGVYIVRVDNESQKVIVK